MWAALGAALGRVPGLACVKQPRAPAPGSPFSHSKAPCMSERTVHGAQSHEQTIRLMRQGKVAERSAGRAVIELQNWRQRTRRPGCPE